MNQKNQGIKENLKSKLEEIRAQEGFPSLSAIAVQGDQVVWSDSVGYSHLESKQAADVNTIYHLGSVTKLFTAVMLIKLRDEGKLSLSDTLQQYIPQLTNPQKKAITLHQLVTHTSGLPMMPDNEVLNEMMQTFPPTLESLKQARFPDRVEILDGLDDDVLVGELGEKVSYSNLGFALLGHVIELVSKRPYTTIIKEEILRPLQMTHSGFWEELADQKNLANCYLPFFSSPVVAPPAMKKISAFVPAGALCATTNDMAQFLKLFVGGYSEVLSTQSIAEMVQLDASTNSARYVEAAESGGIGLGWFISELKGYQVAEHGGADPSTATHLAIMPEKNCGVFVATNSGQNPAAVAEASYTILSML